MPSSRGSFQPRDWTQVSHIAGRFFTLWATREAHVHVYLWIYMYTFTHLYYQSVFNVYLSLYQWSISVSLSTSSYWHLWFQVHSSVLPTCLLVTSLSLRKLAYITLNSCVYLLNPRTLWKQLQNCQLMSLQIRKLLSGVQYSFVVLCL